MKGKMMEWKNKGQEERRKEKERESRGKIK